MRFLCLMIAIAAVLPSAEGFVPTASSLLRSPRAALPATCRRAPLASLSMIYTPPRIEEQDSLTLEEMKEALNRAVSMPSPPARESPKVAVQRSPCTSLYGNWRPTTGTDNWKSASGRVIRKKKAAKDASEDGEPKAKLKGRPPVARMSAVKQELLPEFVARASKVLMLNDGTMDSNLFGQQWKLVHRSAPLTSFKNHKGVAVHQMMTENSEFFIVGETNRAKVKMFEIREEEVAAYLKECGARVGLDSLDGEAELVKLREGIPKNAVIKDALTKEEREDAVEIPVVKNLKLSAPPAVMQSDYVQAIQHEVPQHGKARRSFVYDRRQHKKADTTANKAAVAIPDEASPIAPVSHNDDAAVGPAISLYNAWAVDGRDVVMEVSHEAALADALQETVDALVEKKANFKAVDVGCGNGWAARSIKKIAPEAKVTGIDAASLMVRRAEQIDGERLANYEIGCVHDWAPTGEKMSLVLAVELLHLVKDPQESIKRMASWLKEGGNIIATLECYTENRLSLSWSADLGIPMHSFSEQQWMDMFKAAGLTVEVTRHGMRGGWPGTLVFRANKAAR